MGFGTGNQRVKHLLLVFDGALKFRVNCLALVRVPQAIDHVVAKLDEEGQNLLFSASQLDSVAEVKRLRSERWLCNDREILLVRGLVLLQSLLAKSLKIIEHVDFGVNHQRWEVRNKNYSIIIDVVVPTLF